MTTSVQVKRKTGFESISLEAFQGRDGQGAPSYATAVTIWARTKLEDAVAVGGAQAAVGAPGVEVATTLTVWVGPSETATPTHQDRLTVGGSTYIVMNRKVVKTRKGAVHHTRLQCREE